MSIQPFENGLARFGQIASKYIKDNDNVLVGFGGPGRITIEIASNSRP